MTRVYAAFVGCKVSQADSEAAAAKLAAAGCRVVASRDEADLCVLLSCCVTAEAERKSRQMARRLAADGRRVVVGGCAAALRPEQFREPGVEVLGGRSWVGAALAQPVAAAEQRSATLPAAAEERSATLPTAAADAPTGALRRRTRLMLKVQDGCAQRCAYCAVRLARGPLWSLPLEEAVAAARRGLADGCGEIVLTGVNLGAYRDDDGAELTDLASRLVALPELARLRLSSIEPLHLTPLLLSTLAHPKVARHLHVPLQSADDDVLAAMRRPYSFAEYAATLERARRELPGVMITTDVIVGYPTEDEPAFARTLAAIEPGGGLLSRVHVFGYSQRPGTEAAGLAPLPAVTMKRRLTAALAAADATRRAARRSVLGAPAEVVVEERRDGLWRGYSSQYVRYYLWGAAAPGRLVRACADEEFKDGVKGRII